MKRLVAPVLLGLLLLVAPEAANAAAMATRSRLRGADQLMAPPRRPRSPAASPTPRCGPGSSPRRRCAGRRTGACSWRSRAGSSTSSTASSDPTPTVYADLRPKVDDFLDRGLLGPGGRPAVHLGAAVHLRPVHVRQGPELEPVPALERRLPGSARRRRRRLRRDGPALADRPGRDRARADRGLVQPVLHAHDRRAELRPGRRALRRPRGDGASYTFADYGQGGSPRNPCGDPPGGVGGAHDAADGRRAARCAPSRSGARPASPSRSTARSSASTPTRARPMPDNPARGRRQRQPPPDRRLRHAQPVPLHVPPRHERDLVRRRRLEHVGGGQPRSPTSRRSRNYGWPCYEGDARMSAYDTLNLN